MLLHLIVGGTCFGRKLKFSVPNTQKCRPLGQHTKASNEFCKGGERGPYHHSKTALLSYRQTHQLGELCIIGSLFY